MMSDYINVLYADRELEGMWWIEKKNKKKLNVKNDLRTSGASFSTERFEGLLN